MAAFDYQLNIKLLPVCNNYFHPVFIGKWFTNSNFYIFFQGKGAISRDFIVFF